MTDKHLVARFYSTFAEWAEFSRLIAGGGDFFCQTRVHGKLERSVKLKQRKIIGDRDTFSEDERSMFGNKTAGVT